MTRRKKPTIEENAGRAIRKAAQVLTDRKWIKGSRGTPTDGMCAMGVIAFALTGHIDGFNGDLFRTGLANQAMQIFQTWMRTSGISDSGIAGWNDHKASSKEEVIRVMEKFADEYDPQRV